jgi:hypothetical protein
MNVPRTGKMFTSILRTFKRHVWLLSQNQWITKNVCFHNLQGTKCASWVGGKIWFPYVVDFLQIQSVFHLDSTSSHWNVKTTLIQYVFAQWIFVQYPVSPTSAPQLLLQVPHRVISQWIAFVLKKNNYWKEAPFFSNPSLIITTQTLIAAVK